MIYADWLHNEVHEAMEHDSIGVETMDCEVKVATPPNKSKSRVFVNIVDDRRIDKTINLAKLKNKRAKAAIVTERNTLRALQLDTDKIAKDIDVQANPDIAKQLQEIQRLLQESQKKLAEFQANITDLESKLKDAHTKVDNLEEDVAYYKAHNHKLSEAARQRKRR